MSKRIKKGKAYTALYRMKLKVMADYAHLKLGPDLMDGLWMPICKYENNKPLNDQKVPWAQAWQIAKDHQMENIDHEVEIVP